MILPGRAREGGWSSWGQLERAPWQTEETYFLMQ